MKNRKLASFDEWEAQKMKDSEFRKAAEELEAGYQLARLRVIKGMTQSELARLSGTQQPSIARLESGTVSPSISFLKRVSKALGARVEVRILPEEKNIA